MDDRYGAAWPDVMLRRPAVDPSIPRADRALLLAPGTMLGPAGGARPPRVRDYLPADPDKRGTTVDSAVMGMTAAGFIAIGGTTPYAIGVLIFQGAVGWQAASGRYALLLAEIVVAVTAVLFGARLVRFGQISGTPPSNAAARAYHGRYLTGADFDEPGRALLRRAQDAVDAVTGSEICRAGLLDESATCLALAEQEWDIAVALRDHGRLRRRRAGQARGEVGPETAEVLKWQADAARLADASIGARVAALERYAGEVRAADLAYRDWRRAQALHEQGGQHLDMLARTAADQHGIAEVDELSRQARAVRLALRELS
jgi:hypothetical protein